MIRKTIVVPISKADGGEADGIWAIATKNADRVGDTIAPAALRANVGKRLPALFGHQHSAIVGYWQIIAEKAGKLLAELHLSATSLGKQLKILLDDGVPISASIGFFGEGAANEHGGIHFKEVDIYETSLVAVPANAEAVRIKALAIGLDAEPLIFIDKAPVQLHTRAQRVILKRAAVAIAQTEKITSELCRNENLIRTNSGTSGKT